MDDKQYLAILALIPQYLTVSDASVRGHSSLYTRLSPGTRKCNGRLTTEALSSAAYSYSDCCTGLGQSDHNKETLSLSLCEDIIKRFNLKFSKEKTKFDQGLVRMNRRHALFGSSWNTSFRLRMKY